MDDRRGATGEQELDLFCSPEGEVWRVHSRPTWMPRYLAQAFDADGEAYPVLLDFDDMKAQLEAEQATVEERWSRAGGVQLVARGESAVRLATWLSTAFASGVRAPRTR